MTQRSLRQFRALPVHRRRTLRTQLNLPHLVRKHIRSDIKPRIRQLPQRILDTPRQGQIPGLVQRQPAMRFFDSALRAPLRMTVFPDAHRPHQPVGNVDVRIPVLGRDVLLQDEGVDSCFYRPKYLSLLSAMVGESAGNETRSKVSLPTLGGGSLHNHILIAFPLSSSSHYEGITNARARRDCDCSNGKIAILAENNS